MSNVQAIKLPEGLVEAVGKGEDKHGLIGRRVLITHVPAVNPLALMMLGLPHEPYPAGAEATIIHVDAEGDIWADFGDNDDVVGHGPEGLKVWDIGENASEVGGPSSMGVTYEVLN